MTPEDVGDGEATSVACLHCGRPTYDPDKKERPWARGVAAGAQVLVCPSCQTDRPGWMDPLDRCDRCGSTRLSATLGDVVCRECGHHATSVELGAPIE